MQRIVVAGGVTCLALGLVLVGSRVRIAAAPAGGATDAQVAARPEARPQSHPERPPQSPSTSQLLGRIETAKRQAIDVVKTPRQLNQFLLGQETLARKQGRVDAFVVEPAVAAIQSIHGDAPEEMFRRMNQFTARMASLSAELDHATSLHSPASASTKGP